MVGLGVIADNHPEWGAILLDKAPKPAQPTPLFYENGRRTKSPRNTISVACYLTEPNVRKRIFATESS